MCDKVFAKTSGYGDNIRRIIVKELKPQYDKAFLKHQNEKQAFKLKEKIKFRFGSYKWEQLGGTFSSLERVENDDWIDGVIHKVSRTASGQYKYVIKYLEPADDYHFDMGQIDRKTKMGINFTNPITEKNIRKICKEN